MSDLNIGGSTLEGQQQHMTKKRRTIGLFSPHIGGSSWNNNPTPRTATSSVANSSAVIASRHGGSSTISALSVSSGSFGPAPVGLPDFIIAIPPIPDLDREIDHGCCFEADDRRRTTTTLLLPTITLTPTRPLRPIRRYVSPSTG